MTTSTYGKARICIVAHDFSSFAERAADAALDDLLDSRRGGRIVLVHVALPQIPLAPFDFGVLEPGFSSLEKEALAAAAAGLERVAQRLRTRESLLLAGPSPIAIEATVRIGTPAEGVIEEAQARGAERIFVGTHGRGGLSHLLLGSVAERIARRARVPVVVVHGTRADPEERAGELA